MNDFTTDPCPACKPNTVCRTPSCGRLKGKRQEPVIENKQAEPVSWRMNADLVKSRLEQIIASGNQAELAQEALVCLEAMIAHPAPAVAVNQRMRTALQEIANTVNYAQWYQETAEKALEDANHTEVALDKVAAVAVNEVKNETNS